MQSKQKEIIQIRVNINGIENNRENKWNQKLVYWKDQQNWQTLSYLTTKKEDSNYWSQERKTLHRSANDYRKDCSCL